MLYPEYVSVEVGMNVQIFGTRATNPLDLLRMRLICVNNGPKPCSLGSNTAEELTNRRNDRYIYGGVAPTI